MVELRPLRVLVCGSRTFQSAGPIWSMLDGLAYGYDLTVIEGGAKGADTVAKEWCWVRTEREPMEFPADWVRHGKAAGVLRNQQMLAEGLPNLVVAFLDKPLPESRGTADMVRRAREAGVMTWVVEVHG